MSERFFFYLKKTFNKGFKSAKYLISVIEKVKAIRMNIFVYAILYCMLFLIASNK